jgi:hypothetical protein
MKKMRIDTSTDDSGIVRVQIPGQPSRCQVYVTVEWDEPLAEQACQWPRGWIEATAGSITDPTFVRHPQGEYERREGLE